MQAFQCPLLTAFGWQCMFFGAPVCRLPGVCLPAPRFQILPYRVLPQCTVSSALSTDCHKCAIWFWWLSCRQDWTCQFWERAANSRLSKNVHVGLLHWLWIHCFFCVCQGALPGCLPPFNRDDIWSRWPRWPGTKRSWQVWSNVVRQEWEACQKKTGKVPINWKQTCSLQREATPGQE